MHISYPRIYQDTISMPKLTVMSSASFGVTKLPKNAISFQTFHIDQITTFKIRNRPPLILEKNTKSIENLKKESLYL